MRTTLQRYARNTGKVDPLLRLQWPPWGLALWRTFRGFKRQPAFSGIGPVSLLEIEAYQRLHRVVFTAWELAIFELFDSIAMEKLNTQQEAE